MVCPNPLVRLNYNVCGKKINMNGISANYSRNHIQETPAARALTSRTGRRPRPLPGSVRTFPSYPHKYFARQYTNIHQASSEWYLLGQSTHMGVCCGIWSENFLHRRDFFRNNSGNLLYISANLCNYSLEI